MHQSWIDLLKEEMNKDYFKHIEEYVRKDRETKNVFPEKGLVFNAFTSDFNNIKVVILGQN